MNIEITQESITIDSIVINKTDNLDIIFKILGSNYREIVIVEGERYLYIYDDLGIRFWVEKNKFSGIQVQLNKEDESEIFPFNDFIGYIRIYGKITILNKDFELLPDVIKLLELEKDTDSVLS